MAKATLQAARVPLDLTLDPRRVLLLARNLVAFRGRALLTAAAALSVSYLFLYVCTLWGAGGGAVMEGLWGALGLVGSWILAAGAFADSHRASRAVWWFLLPASVLEKYVAAVLLALAAMVVAFPLLGLVLDLVSRATALVLWGRDHQGFNPLGRGFFWSLAVGLALMPVFFFGSVLFKKTAFFKTLLAVFAFLVLLGAAVAGLGWLFFGQGSPEVSLGNGLAQWAGQDVSDLLPWFQWGSGILLFLVVPVFFLVAGFLKLTESEADDGVS